MDRYNIADSWCCDSNRGLLFVRDNLGWKWRNEMRKIAVLIGGLALAGCGAGVVTTVTSIFDQIQQAARTACGYTFAFATIDALIKALGGPPIVETISGILCTQARALVVQEVPKAAGADPATGRTTVVLGTVVINGKPVTITVLR